MGFLVHAKLLSISSTEFLILGLSQTIVNYMKGTYMLSHTLIMCHVKHTLTKGLG